MAIVLSTPPYSAFYDDNGNPLSGGKVYTYLAGTSTPRATYTDQSGSTPNANPVILDAAGRASIWLDDSAAYKFTVTTSADVVVRTQDNITPFSTASGLAVLGNIAANTLVGNNTGSPATPTALTTAQVLAMLNISSNTGMRRQTVVSGPVGTTGLAAFGGSTGSTTVTASGTLVVSAAQGAATRFGTIVNPSWTGLSTNGTMFLFLDVAADGTCTTGSTTQTPVYQFGGTPATTSGLFTFNIQEMTAYVGNGSSAPATYRVMVGEVTVSGGVVTAITWYQLQGRYQQPLGTAPINGQQTITHNLGVRPFVIQLGIQCISAEFGYAVGDIAVPFTHRGAGQYSPMGFNNNNRNSGIISPTTVNTTPYVVMNLSTNDYSAVTLASWNLRNFIDRGW